MVLAHPFVIGELALGGLRWRALILDALSDLPQATVATDTEVLRFINRHHLLAAFRLTTAAALWTNDKRLHAVAERLGLAM
jgi:hypothetical protein